MRAAGRKLAEGPVVPLGVAIAVGLGVAQVVPPRWRTGGAPYVAAFGKNVEWLAVVVGRAAGAATLLLTRCRSYALCIAIAALGAGLAIHLCSAPAVPPLLPLRGAAVLIATALALVCWDPARPAPVAPPVGAPA